MKKLLLSGIGLLLAGCLIPYEDTAEGRSAVRAVDAWDSRVKTDLPPRVTMEWLLTRLPRQKSGSARCEFARLLRARELAKRFRSPLRPDELRAALLAGECARIRLNTLLGVRPDAKIDYDPAGAFAVPPELPDPESAAKAALVLRDDDRPVESVLERVALAHARAVAAYDAAGHAASPEEKIDRECARVVAVQDLADALGLPFDKLNEVETLAGRFDTVKRHREVTFR